MNIETFQLPEITEIDNLEATITRLEQKLAGLDRGLDFRQYYLIEIQLAIYYQFLMFQRPDTSAYVRHSAMNAENYLTTNE